MKQKPNSLNKTDIGYPWAFFLIWLLRYCFFLAAIAFIPLLSTAQNSITVKSINLPQPFDHSEIKHMMLDNEGFLWFVTNQGIWRFDGTDVQPVDIHNPALPQNSVPEDIYRYRNFLFFNLHDLPTDTFRILCYNMDSKRLKQFKMPGRPLNFMNDNAGAFTFITTDGSKWTFTNNSGLHQTDKYFTRKGWVKGSVVDQYVNDKDGNTYILSNKKVGLIQKDSVLWSKINAADQRFTLARRGYCNSKYIFVECIGGFEVYDKSNLQKVFESYGANYTLGLPTKEGMLPVFRVIKDLRIQCRYEEPGTNKTLVGTDKGILEISPSFEMPDETDQRQLLVDFFKDKSIRSIYRSPNGKLYIGTYQGFFVFDGRGFKLITKYIGYTIEAINENTLLVGMEGGSGFFLVDTRTDEGHLNPDKDHTIGTTKIIKYGNGYLTGAYAYIYYLTALADGNYEVTTWLKDLDLGIVKDLKFIDGQLWIASTGGLFKIMKNGQAHKVYPAGGSLACYSILEDNDGIWIGTNGQGLVKIDAGGKLIKAIHFSDGLAGEYVYSIFKLNKLVVAGTSGGISVFDQASGMQPLAIPDLPTYDGNLYQEFNHSAIFDDSSKHMLILGGTQGLTFLDKDYLKSVAGKADDRIRLSYVKKGYNTSRPTATDIFVSRDDTIVISPENNFTGIKFSGPFNQKYVLFRIKEIDTKWHQGKLSDEVSLFAIPPGKYTIQARFPSLTNPQYWLTEQLIVVPRFYQTFLFKIAVVLLFLLIIYMAWRYNANKIRQEQQMRTAIASDLHDEIGSTLTRISINSELLTMGETADKDALETISNDSKKAISSISDIIWSVDARNDNKEDLVLRMKDHAHKMLEDIAEVHYSVNGLSSTVNIPQSLRQNIYLIFKEAVNNIIRHNVSPEVWIMIENGHDGFMMEVKNTIQHKKGTGYRGQGLKNMEMRAKRINATVKVDETDGIFSVTLKMKEWK
jgi:hypothetical protein